MYIKTDFHIYEIKSEEIIQGEKYYNIEIQGGLNKLKAEFGKQSENLDELCDMTIVVDDERPNSVFELEWGIDKELLSKYKDVEGVYVYGAIYTSKGLIYVAKMDENGVLELI